MAETVPPNTFHIPEKLETEEERALFTESVVGLINLAVRNRSRFEELSFDLHCFSFYFNLVASQSQKRSLVFSIQKILSLYPTDVERKCFILGSISSELRIEPSAHFKTSVRDKDLKEIGLSKELLRKLVQEADFTREVAEELFPDDPENPIKAILILLSVGVCFFLATLLFGSYEKAFHTFGELPTPSPNSVPPPERKEPVELQESMITDIEAKTTDQPPKLAMFDISVKTEASGSERISRYIPELKRIAIRSFSNRSQAELVSDFQNDGLSNELHVNFNSFLAQGKEKEFIFGVRIRMLRFF